MSINNNLTSRNDFEKAFSFRERHWVPWLMICVDIASLELSLFLGYIIRNSFHQWWPLSLSHDQYTKIAIALLLVPAGYGLLDLYPGYALTAVEKVRRRVSATFVIFLLFSVWEYLEGGSPGSRSIICLTFVFAQFFPLVINDIVRRFLIKVGCWGTPVLVLGGDKTGRMLVSDLKNNLGLGLRPVAIFDDDVSKWGTDIEGIPIIGDTKKAKEFAGLAKYAMIAMPRAERQFISDLAKNLPFPHILLIPDLFEMQSLWVEVRDLNGVLSLEFKKNLLLKKNWLAKRLLDYSLSVPIFILHLPVFAVIAAAIKIISPGPVFYFQEREGFMGKKFKVWKFRTMYLDADMHLERHLEENPEAAEEWQRFFKLKKDPRVLPFIGSFLRKSSLDELPQLWNVLRGEMSLVGPRPFPQYHLEMFSQQFRVMRSSVLPGITGLWQVSTRSEGDLSMQESLDTYYIRNWSIWLDLYILVKTVWVVMKRKGAY